MTKILKDLILNRYSAKSFESKSVSEECILEILEAIRMAPSSFNLQPWKIRMITDSAIKEKLRPASWNQAQITECSHLIVFCAYLKFEDLADRLEALMRTVGPSPEKLKIYRGLVRGFLEALPPEKRLPWAQRQVYLALENALLMAEALGLAACPMEGFDVVQYQEILQLPPSCVPTVLMPVGYSSGKSTPKLRFSREDILLG